MTDVIKRIKDLVARAAHEATPEEESRSCAVIAVKLMAKHDVRLSLPGAKRADLLDEFFRRSREHAETERRQQEADREAAEKRARAQEACKADRRKRRPFYADTPCPTCGKTH